MLDDDDDFEPLPIWVPNRAEGPSHVPCAHCDAMIIASATRCPECGVHFRGQAQDFNPREDDDGWTFRPWVMVAVIAAFVVLLLVIVEL